MNLAPTVAATRSVYRVPEAWEEDFTAACWLRGCLGLEIKAGDVAGSLRVEVYEPPSSARGRFDHPHAERLRTEDVLEADWMAPYREHVQPFAVGRRFLLDPREPQELGRPLDGRIWLRLPARSAFGTGSHESTRLVLELLERTEVRGRRVLDVGTGTGVLAFAAAMLGARAAVGFDVDVLAPLHAAVNARLNSSPSPAQRSGVAPAFFAGSLAALDPARGFDLALVNVVPEQIGPDLEALVARLAPAATVIFSGILRLAGPRFLRTLRGHGLVRRAARTAGEWVAYRTELVAR
jgi:ribosomal protein L11 methyltransferase